MPPSPTDLQGRARAIAILLAALAGAALVASAYWPGLVTWDPVRQYGQALNGKFDDWHPPAMGWVWRQLARVQRGPAPMLLLQVGLYWAGLALIALRMRERPWLAVALLAWGLLPIPLALMGAILKDCLMAGAMLTATGLWLWTRDGAVRGCNLVFRLLAAALLLFAAMLRFNAFLACLPLMVALAPPRWRSNWLPLAVTTLISMALLVAALPVANRLIGASKSGVELSLILFDLGGITEHGGVDVFPPIDDVRDPVAANHRCYKPVKWDSYSDWVDPECPLGFSAIQDWLDDHPDHPTRWWFKAVAAHPIAYAEHRLAHFNINSRFLVREQVDRPVPIDTAPNPWHFKITPNPLLSAIDGVARASAATPLGWPIAWMALAFGLLALSPRLPSRAVIIPLALSALLYGAGYLVFSVSSELRYHLWTMLAALLAAVLTVADLWTIQVSWRRLIWSLVPLAVTILLATAWRLA